MGEITATLCRVVILKVRLVHLVIYLSRCSAGGLYIHDIKASTDISGDT